MNISGSNSNGAIVSLQQLVPQHDCLKLLILHTPYTLKIDTLPLCVNLVKLDLSKNNLEGFPYLGELNNLRLMFLHENKLGVQQLINIFEVNGVKSTLSNKIVWVTFWGNKNSFLGRHYLVNQTNAIAVDHHMITYEQKCPDFPAYHNNEAFAGVTDISKYFDKKVVNRHASEEEYMSELWLEMRELRKKHQQLFSVIKIQKVFRGWKIRVNYQRQYQHQKEVHSIQAMFFQQWKKYTSKQVKLKSIVEKKYLLVQGKKGRLFQIFTRMIELSQQAKLRVERRRNLFHSQIRFYKSLKGNFQHLKNLYNMLEINKSSAIYICRTDWNLFKEFVVPFASRFSDEEVLPQDNQEFVVRYIFDFMGEKTKEMLKIISAN